MKLKSQTIHLDEWGDELKIHLPNSRSLKITLSKNELLENDDVRVVYVNGAVRGNKFTYKLNRRLQQDMDYR